MNILISGPCGVGKTTISKKIALSMGRNYFNFDEIGLLDMEERKPNISPFSHFGLNLLECMRIMLEKNKGEFILEIGGDNIFRQGANNLKYLTDLYEIKRRYSMKIFVIHADKNSLYGRFFKTRSNTRYNNFEKIWCDWVNIIKPNWEKCSDFWLDTSSLSIIKTCQILEEKIRDLSL